MKVRVETWLTIWAIGTVSLVAFVVLEPFEATIGAQIIDATQLCITCAVACCFKPLRAWFAGWLAKQR